MTPRHRTNLLRPAARVASIAAYSLLCMVGCGGKLPAEKAEEAAKDYEKGTHGGRLLSEGTFQAEVTIYERGEALKRRCEELLRHAEARVEKITLDASGRPTGTEPLDVN